MKIIQTAKAPNPRRVRIFLAEKQIDIPYQNIPFEMDALRSAGFTALNPLRRVPVLVLDDGTCITESVAICRYFEEIQPQPALFGTSPLDRAEVEMWNRRAELGLFFHVAQIFRHTHPSMAEFESPQVAEWAEANRPKLAEQLQVFDKRLADTPFLAGSDYSIADITALVAVDFMRAAKLSIPPDLKNLTRWHNSVSARPSSAA